MTLHVYSNTNWSLIVIFKALYLPFIYMTTLQFIYKMSVLCVTGKIQFDNTSTCKLLNHTHPPLGRYAPSRICPPLFKNSGSAPEASVQTRVNNITELT